MRDLGLLILRSSLGGLLMAHGAQKLFGKFGGHGLEGTGKFFQSLGFEPGEPWAFTAGMGEFGGGALTVLGFMHPLGPLTTIGPMAVAWARVHGGKPIFVTEGGGELPATNIAIAAGLAMIGPGRLSLDHLFGIRSHPLLGILAGAAVAGGTLIALSQPQPEQPQQAAEQPQRDPASAT